jgi:cell division septum initiation protein DivIVA
MTDEETKRMADLTRRLADTAIDYKQRCEELEAKLAQQDDLVQAAVAAALTEATKALDYYVDADYCAMGYPEDGGIAASGTARACQAAILALITPDAQAALDRMLAAEQERCAQVAFDAGCGWQALRTAALSSSWPEDAAKHLASEHAAFTILALIRKGGE